MTNTLLEVCKGDLLNPQVTAHCLLLCCCCCDLYMLEVDLVFQLGGLTQVVLNPKVGGQGLPGITVEKQQQQVGNQLWAFRTDLTVYVFSILFIY